MMKTMYPEHWPQFYTATINNWQHLLADNKHKDIIVDSLSRFCSNWFYSWKGSDIGIELNTKRGHSVY